MVRTLVVLGFTVFSIGVAAQKPPVNAVAQEMVDFHKRIDGKVRDEATKNLPDVKRDRRSRQDQRARKALSRRSRKREPRRSRATSSAQEMSVRRKVLAEDWKSRSPADRKALFEELPKGIKLTVNQPYPTTLPLVSVPANLWRDFHAPEALGVSADRSLLSAPRSRREPDRRRAFQRVSHTRQVIAMRAHTSSASTSRSARTAYVAGVRVARHRPCVGDATASSRTVVHSRSRHREKDSVRFAIIDTYADVGATGR